MEVMVQNRSRHFSASHLMVFPAMADASSKSVPLPFLEKRASLETSWTGRLFKRGWNDQKQVFVTSTWPLGVFEARLVSSFSDAHSSELDGILVVPRPLTPDFLLNTIRLLEEKGQMTTGIEADAPTEFRYLREFRPGDSVKNIHWPSSTRAGQFFIKETDPPIPQPLEYGLLLF